MFAVLCSACGLAHRFGRAAGHCAAEPSPLLHAGRARPCRCWRRRAARRLRRRGDGPSASPETARASCGRGQSAGPASEASPRRDDEHDDHDRPPANSSGFTASSARFATDDLDARRIGDVDEHQRGTGDTAPAAADDRPEHLNLRVRSRRDWHTDGRPHERDDTTASPCHGAEYDPYEQADALDVELDDVHDHVHDDLDDNDQHHDPAEHHHGVLGRAAGCCDPRWRSARGPERDGDDALMAGAWITDRTSRASRVAVVSTWSATGGFLAWSIVFFSAEVDVAPRRTIATVGLLAAIVVFVGWAAVTTSHLRRRSSRPGAPEPVRERGADPAPHVLLGADEAAGRAGRALSTLRSVAPEAPDVALARVGHHGVEILLVSPLGVAPDGFELLDDGRTLRSLEEGIPAGDDDEGRGALELLGSDDVGHYFARAETATFADALPQSEAKGASGLLILENSGGVVVEPYGLHLARPAVTSLPSFESAGDSDIAVVDESLEGACAEGVLSQARPSDGRRRDDADAILHDAPGGTDGSGQLDDALLTPLVAPGVVEVRILREEPDLVGELRAPTNAPAVEFVAYLATHGHRATTARLQDSLGTARSRQSRSTKTVWTAAGAARQALGEEMVPAASGNQVYLLSPAVTCDWTRFQALLALAHEGDDTLRRRALREALAPVDGVPGLASRRYGWLDLEGFLAEITHQVVAAALELARLELATITDHDAADDAALRQVLAKARLLSPTSEELAAVEAELRARHGAVAERHS